MKTQPPPHATTRELVKSMCLEVDSAIKGAGQDAKVTGGKFDGKGKAITAEFWLNGLIINRWAVLSTLMIRHPAISFEITESRIRCSMNSHPTGTVKHEEKMILPFVAPVPK